MKTLILQCTLFLSILFCLLFLTYGQAQAEIAIFEKFECKPINGNWDNIIAKLEVVDKDSGFITLIGEVHFTKYHVDGFTRRWSYGEKTKLDMFAYTIIMKLDGETGFYDFRDSEDGDAYPTMKAQCRKTK